jgi:superfamily II DNA/RNA helicase
MFTTAGFNVNRLKMFIIDDADSILKLRHETKLMRMSNSINKTQRIISQRLTGRIESLVDKMMVAYLFEIEEGKEEDEEEEETK